MMLLTATNASDADPVAAARLSDGAFRFNVTFDLPIQNRRSNAPVLLETILSKMREHDDNVKFIDASGKSIDLRKFPQDKTTFDDTFKPINPRNKPNKLVLGFNVCSCFCF